MKTQEKTPKQKTPIFGNLQKNTQKKTPILRFCQKNTQTKKHQFLKIGGKTPKKKPQKNTFLTTIVAVATAEFYNIHIASIDI